MNRYLSGTIFVVILCSFFCTKAQIGFNNSTPAECAVLDLSHLRGGLLFPRHDSITFGTIVPSALTLYDKQSGSICWRDSINSEWQMMNPWYSASGNLNTILLRKTGNVGINESNPPYKLTVNGRVLVNSLRVAGLINSTGNAESGTFINVGGNVNVTGIATAVGFVGNGTAPKNSIILWYGRPSEIPAGWAIYNDVLYDMIPTDTYVYNFGAASKTVSDSTYTVAAMVPQEKSQTTENKANEPQLYLLYKTQ